MNLSYSCCWRNRRRKRPSEENSPCQFNRYVAYQTTTTAAADVGFVPILMFVIVLQLQLLAVVHTNTVSTNAFIMHDTITIRQGHTAASGIAYNQRTLVPYQTIRTILSATKEPSRPQQSDTSTTTNTRSNNKTNSKKMKKSVATKKSSSSSSSSTVVKQQNEDGAFQSWRIYGIEVHPDRLVDGSSSSSDSGKMTDDFQVSSSSLDLESTMAQTATEVNIHPAIMEALRIRLNMPIKHLPLVETDTTGSSSVIQSVKIIRRSVDARSHQQRSDQLYGPRYVYVIDFVIHIMQMKQQYKNIRPWKHQPGRMELLSTSSYLTSLVSLPLTPQPILCTVNDVVFTNDPRPSSSSSSSSSTKKPRVIIVGAGPAGLFCALQLAKSGMVTPIILERGQPVETRGKDIGAFIHRKSLNTESNFAFGEGGAGTWSDGKLTTRIGRNSDMVRKVLETFVQYGAPSNILIEGAPHLGTDNLVRLLRNMRQDLRQMGGIIRFGTKVTELIIENNITVGVKYDVSRETIERNVGTLEKEVEAESSDNDGIMMGDSVVLATGHSARDVYEQLHAAGVCLEAKGFAVGFRVEHPQKIINNIQYGQEWGPSVVTGKGTTDTANHDYFSTLVDTPVDALTVQRHEGKLPVPSYRLATDKAYDGKSSRGVYSFCMCPGGQIVPASTEHNEICVNGMSFSRRDSLYANSALVVTVDHDDEVLEPYRSKYGVLAGIAFQRDMERRAAIMGGGNFVVPVQRITDFLSGTASTSAPPSSYRLGVKPAPCHLIYPEPLVASMKNALVEYFNRQMPGFICDDGLLHAVETRTSSPVRIVRDSETFQAIGTKNLFPAGEGAGFAGGIVSAAVDGISVADAILSERFGNNFSSASMNDDSTVLTY